MLTLRLTFGERVPGFLSPTARCYNKISHFPSYKLAGLVMAYIIRKFTQKYAMAQHLVCEHADRPNLLWNCLCAGPCACPIARISPKQIEVRRKERFCVLIFEWSSHVAFEENTRYSVRWAVDSDSLRFCLSNTRCRNVSPATYCNSDQGITYSCDSWQFDSVGQPASSAESTGSHARLRHRI